MRKKILFLIYVGFPIVIFGQEVNDLIKELQFKLADTVSVSTNLKIGNLYSNMDSDSAIYYYNIALELATKINSEPQMAESLYKIAVYYNNTSNKKNAIKNYLKAVVVFEKLDSVKKAAKIYNYIGSNYLKLYAEGKAIEYYLKSLKLFEDIGDGKGMALNYLGFGNLFYSKENYKLAKIYFYDALEIYKELDDKEGIAVSYTNLGNAMAEDGDNFKGLEYYKKSIEIEKELNDEYGIGVNYNNIGDCYIKLKQFDDALNNFSKALEVAKKMNKPELISVVLLNISDVKFQTKKYKSGIYYAKNSLKTAKEIGNLVYQGENFSGLSNAYESLGNYSQALNYSKQYVKIKDSLLKIDNTNKIKLFQALSDLEKTNYTINDLSIKNKITESKYETGKKFTYFLIGAMLVFGFFVILLIQQQTAKRKAYNLLEYKNHQINKMNDEIETQRDYLKQLNSTKDKFFSIIAHDLKNPFNSIQGFTELMIENGHEYDEKKRLKFLKIIKGSTFKASSLLNNLLIWANSQSGNLEFKPEEVELIQKVSDVISLLEIQAINKDIQILNNISNNLFVDADQNMLAVILRNLISNAIKFTEMKGEIQITSKVSSNFVEITVKDNGVGIAQDDVDNLFSIEVKKSNIGTANEQGSGLGLILCKDFVEKHGGNLWVESSLNKGSEFKFTLPVAV